MVRIISSQHYLDADIVAEKIAAVDFEVLVSPVFEIDGESYRVVIDGHHSLAAAKAAGEAPVFVEATVQDSDRVALIERGEIEDFMELSYVDGEWYDVATGRAVW